MELLPLVEMYCYYELQEDCTNLRSLMLRFDSERELETCELGRSLLHMLRDDDEGMDFSSRRLHLDVPSNPFDAIKGRIADIDVAFRALQPQVRLPLDFTCQGPLAGMPAMAFAMPEYLYPDFSINKTLPCLVFFKDTFISLWLIVVCLAPNFSVCIRLSVGLGNGFGAPFKFRPPPCCVLSSFSPPFPSSWFFCAFHLIRSGIVCVRHA